MIFVRAVLGGLAAAALIWVIVVTLDIWRFRSINRHHGITGLGAMAGGWDFLLHMPLVIVLLTVAFGIGLYLASR